MQPALTLSHCDMLGINFFYNNTINKKNMQNILLKIKDKHLLRRLHFIHKRKRTNNIHFERRNNTCVLSAMA